MGIAAYDRQFHPGDRVEVRHLGKPGHVRIPFYVRGKRGEIVNFCGRYLNPEDLAVGNTSGPAIDLYRVKFAQRDLWLDKEIPEHDYLVIEIYDHWLSSLESNEGRR